MKYLFSFPERNARLADITLTVNDCSGDELDIHLPAWRPGRYELGNFAKNIRSWKAYDDRGELLPFQKMAKDHWRVQTQGASTVIVRYTYYCAQPDAGACWIDEDLVYINPVHCCLYIPDRMHVPCEVTLDIPSDYAVACSMESTGHGHFLASDFHELVDSPWLASTSLTCHRYQERGVDFHVWIHGADLEDKEKVMDDFSRFTRVQLDVMGGIPVDQFHFLILALPFRYYHGVEHLKSTVLALGPAQSLFDGSLYIDLLGVASHELFHVWNIKYIRPADMLPYDYSTENYSRLGFVYEGVTTYYGDLFLCRSGVYSHQQFFAELNVRLQRHFDSHARFHLPVAEASFDTWLDGYVPGVPHRKTSIYDEGCLIALMTDLMIRRSTDGKANLDDVMRMLYQDFGKHGIGYTEADYITVVEQVAQAPLADFFLDHVYGTEDYEPRLRDLLEWVGCDISLDPSPRLYEKQYGFKILIDGQGSKVAAVLPGSPAFLAGMAKDDEVIAVNGIKVEGNLSELCLSEIVDLTVVTPMKKIKVIRLAADRENYFPVIRLNYLPQATSEQKSRREAWLGGIATPLS